jgi:hypothetical protein
MIMISRWALKIVVMTREQGTGKKEEGRSENARVLNIYCQ